ncbi:MAG: hypothetical protein AB8H03_03815 [Saprospiraceae bacterium]
MRKINKNCALSSEYKNWEEHLTIPHPKYTSSNHRFYNDIRMQLYRCQGGLCAYTEVRLCPEEYFVAENWSDGKFTAKIPNQNLKGQLDHFDANLKSKKSDTVGRQDWLWDNFFMVESDTNTKAKNDLPVDEILKPDRDDYDPFQLLEYDNELHVFKANSELDNETQNKINETINNLGINTVWFKRRDYIKDKVRPVSLEEVSFDDIEVTEFPTAFKMYKNNVGGKAIDSIL